MKALRIIGPAFSSILWTVALQAAAGAEPAGPVWLPPSTSAVRVAEQDPATALVRSDTADLFTVESAQAHDARPGDAFEIAVRVRVGINARMLPELACYDAEGREIAGIPALEAGTRFTTTEWQDFRRVFPARPGTTRVRARLRGNGRGEYQVAGLTFRPVKIDPYQTGALITQLDAAQRRGIVFESNFGIVDRNLISNEDRDSDGKWALITVDLDQLTKPKSAGADWRSSFEDNPNEILWSDGTVLKSDSIRADRSPDANLALHFRMRAHSGPFDVTISDPGRAVAVSLDGKSWTRHAGGREIVFKNVPISDGVVEFWLDACYRDPVSAGPAYFDYVRLMPTEQAASVDELFAAARRKPAPARIALDKRSLPVAVQAPQFAQGSNWPVRCGVPLPRGDLMAPTNVTVWSADGRRVPAQCRTMATWPDGSIRWLYLDFAHDCRNAGESQYVVQYGNNIGPAPIVQSIRIEPGEKGLEVDTGAIRFTVPKDRFGIFENVRLADGRVWQRAPLRAEIEEADGFVWNAGELPVERIAVEQAGPLHAVIVVETKMAASGRPARGFYHRARIHAYAGSPLVQVDYFVANTDSRPAGDVGGSMASKVSVRSFAVKVRPEGAVRRVEHSLARANAPGSVIQKDGNRVIERDSESRESDGRLAGWLTAELDDQRSLVVGVEKLREQFPKGFRWKPDELEIALWAPEGGVFEWIERVGKTHRLSFFYGTAGAGDGALVAQGPVLALASPEWFISSGAFDPQVAAADSGLPEVERTLARHMTNDVIARVGLGFENYGDHNSGGYVAGTVLWDNNEYDLPAGCMVHFVRTGDRAALQLGLASALHYLDVDTIHYSSQHADWARAQHVHSHAEFGHHTAQGPDFHHAGYVRGLIWYDYFLGESAGTEGARGIADWVLRAYQIQTRSMERAVGHPLTTLTDVYEATGDERYLRGAAAWVDQALKWEHPIRSGWLGPITESPAYYSGSPFCSGLLPSALIKFNSWAGRPDIDAMLLRVARWTLTDVWRPNGGIQHKGGSPREEAGAEHIASHGRLMEYAFARTQDPLFLVVPRESVVLGFTERQTIGTRATGLVFNHLPPFFAALAANGDPQPDPQLQLTISDKEIEMSRGGGARINCKLTNTGNEPVTNVRLSLQSRLDFATTPATARALDSLNAGKSAEFEFDLAAPQNLNLGSEQNRIAYVHACVLAKRGESACSAHAVTKITVR